jgi:hypothetical protein
MKLCFSVVLFSALPVLLYGQLPSDGVYRVGSGVTPPRVLHKVDPEYSPAAKNDRIQGNRADAHRRG